MIALLPGPSVTQPQKSVHTIHLSKPVYELRASPPLLRSSNHRLYSDCEHWPYCDGNRCRITGVPLSRMARLKSKSDHPSSGRDAESRKRSLRSFGDDLVAYYQVAAPL